MLGCECGGVSITTSSHPLPLRSASRSTTGVASSPPTTAGAAACRRLLHLRVEPCGSMSMIAALRPSISACTASERVSIDLPTPPFCARTAITFIVYQYGSTFAYVHTCILFGERSTEIFAYKYKICKHTSVQSY